jgi:hypothetical protein
MFTLSWPRLAHKRLPLSLVNMRYKTNRSTLPWYDESESDNVINAPDATLGAPNAAAHRELSNRDLSAFSHPQPGGDAVARL